MCIIHNATYLFVYSGAVSKHYVSAYETSNERVQRLLFAFVRLPLK